MEIERTKYLRELRREILSHFNIEELQTVAFDLGLDWDNIAGGNTKAVKTQNLLKTLIHHGRLNNLIVLLREERPNSEWADAPSATQQIEDEQLISSYSNSYYRDALLRAAHDFQSRLYNIVKQGFLQVYGITYPEYRDYAINNTCYVIAEYLCWVEILRRSGQFVDLGIASKNQKFEASLVEISHTLSRDDIGRDFILFRGEQRAIGELMLTRLESATEPLGSIGYAEFIRRLSDDDFNRWFLRFQDNIEALIEHPQSDSKRLVLLQRGLIDLINVLDPETIRIGKKFRQKLQLG